MEIDRQALIASLMMGAISLALAFAAGAHTYDNISTYSDGRQELGSALKTAVAQAALEGGEMTAEGYATAGALVRESDIAGDENEAFYVPEFNPKPAVRLAISCTAPGCIARSQDGKPQLELTRTGWYAANVSCERRRAAADCRVAIASASGIAPKAAVASDNTTGLHTAMLKEIGDDMARQAQAEAALGAAPTLEKPFRLLGMEPTASVAADNILLARLAVAEGALSPENTYFGAAAGRYNFTYPDGSLTEDAFVGNMRGRARKAALRDYDTGSLARQAAASLDSAGGALARGVAKLALPVQMPLAAVAIAKRNIAEGITPELALAYDTTKFDDRQTRALRAMVVFGNERKRRLANGGSDGFPAAMAQDEIKWIEANRAANASMEIACFKGTVIDFSQVRATEKGDSAWLAVPEAIKNVASRDKAKLTVMQDAVLRITTTRECDISSCRYMVFVSNGRGPDDGSAPFYISTIGAGT